jgi:tRNA(Arg) A34 adenosine deaminase TadA
LQDWPDTGFWGTGIRPAKTVRHAETELARRAAAAYPAEFFWTCTLVSTGEPCAMCTGTLYWANIGRLVYGFEEAKLLAETGDHPENPTMSLAALTVLGSGQKPIEVVGPVPEIADELLAPHRDFWKRYAVAEARDGVRDDRGDQGGTSPLPRRG